MLTSFGTEFTDAIGANADGRRRPSGFSSGLAFETIKSLISGRAVFVPKLTL
jgi:hypothetical protein